MNDPRDVKPSAVYGVIDLQLKQLRYIGVTTLNLGQRLYALRSSSNKSPATFWLKHHAIKSLDIFEIERCQPDTWTEAETFWIAYFRSIGVNLLNSSAGGRGVKMCRTDVSAKNRALAGDPEWRKIIQAAAKKRSRNIAWRQNVGKASKQRASTPEALARLALVSQGNIGRKKTPETIRKLRAVKHVRDTKGQFSKRNPSLTS